MLRKSLQQIAERDFLDLVAQRTAEQRSLDYKRDLVGSSDRDRQEFLADVTSFANSAGGDLIFGVREDAGAPVAVDGLDLANPDSEILRLEQIIRSGVRPSIAGIETRAVPLLSGRFIVVVRIPRSWARPHQIAGSFRFFGRASNGKYQLDVDELRAIFRQGPDLAEQVRHFRAGRLSSILAGDTPAKLHDEAKIVTHVIPLNEFATRAAIDLWPVAENPVLLTSIMRGSGAGSAKRNLDGYLAYITDGSLCSSYAQLFRDGCLEVVETMPSWFVNDKNYLPGTAFDEMAINVVRGFKALYATLNVTPPVSAMISLFGMADRIIGAGGRAHRNSTRLGSDRLVCPETVVTSFLTDDASIAFAIQNPAWNAGGYEHSANFTRDGVWRPLA